MPRSHSTSSSVVMRSMLRNPFSWKNATCSSETSAWKSVVGFICSPLTRSIKLAVISLYGFHVDCSIRGHAQALVQPVPRFHVGQQDRPRVDRHLGGHFLWYHHHAVIIAPDQVARAHLHATAPHSYLHLGDLDTTGDDRAPPGTGAD